MCVRVESAAAALEKVACVSLKKASEKKKDVYLHPVGPVFHEFVPVFRVVFHDFFPVDVISFLFLRRV